MGNFTLILKKIIAVFLLLSFTGGGLFYYSLKKPGPLSDTKTVIIVKGSSSSHIADQLKKEGIINSSLIFQIISYGLQSKYNLKAGEFMFTPQQSIFDVLRHIDSGAVVQHKLVIPEGSSTAEIVEWLKENDLLSGELTTLPPEGSLLPETYFYTYDDQRTVLIQRMQQAMNHLMDELWAKRPPNCPLTRQEALILASIIEKETSIKEERRHISGVFHNRLRLGMKLQTDPTVIYAMTKGHPLGRSLTLIDLAFSSPYNTYLHLGLPPGPIANPGRASIEAALHPLPTKNLYFVADGKGGHVFSATYKDHLRHVEKLRSLQINNTDR